MVVARAEGGQDTNQEGHCPEHAPRCLLFSSWTLTFPTRKMPSVPCPKPHNHVSLQSFFSGGKGAQTRTAIVPTQEVFHPPAMGMHTSLLNSQLER